MNKKVMAGIGVAAVLLVVLSLSVFATDWDDYTEYDEPQEIPFTGVVDEDDNIDTSSLNYNVFEKYGPVLLILAVLMFGAIIGGVCIAREEEDKDDSN